jgi:iron complex outermembrane receptor protein
MSLGGFQLNWDRSERDNMLVQGNMYKGQMETSPFKSVTDGQNITGRWFHGFSDKSDITVQLYFDRTLRRDIPSTFNDELATYDFDFQHHFPAGKKHDILWGTGYRFMHNNTQNSTPFVGFVPRERNMDLFSGFIQDEISLVPEKLKFTIGSKLQHNDFSGFDLQPSGRLAWSANERNTLWAAVSRAIRAPSRIDVDYRLPTYTVPSNSVSIQGIPGFDSEKVLAYESGYRFNPSSQLLVSLAGFYNKYDDVYSIDSLPGTATLLIRNGTKGKSYGAELSVNAQISSFWKLRGGYSYFHKEMEGKPGSNSLLIALSNLGIDAKNRVVLQSVLDLSRSFQLDLVSRYTSKLPASQFTSQLPSEFNLDARLAYQLKQLEISVAGQNLLDKLHPEYGTVQISRNIYGKITWRLK